MAHIFQELMKALPIVSYEPQTEALGQFDQQPPQKVTNWSNQTNQINQNQPAPAPR